MEYLPLDYNTNTTAKYPLLIYWPGVGEALGNAGGGVQGLCNLLRVALPSVVNSNRFPEPVLDQNNQPFSYIFIAPLMTNFAGLNNVVEANAVIDYMVQNYRVNTKRIYATGISFGSYLLMDHATSSVNNGKKLAAINTQANCFPDTITGFSGRLANIVAANVHLWGVHCSIDPTCTTDWIQAWVTGMNNANPGLAQLTTVPECAGHHGVWPLGYDPDWRVNNKNVYEYLIQYSSNYALPARLKLYTAKLDNSKVTIEWTTTSEENTDYFILERSSMNQSFQQIATLTAAGSSAVEKKYSFTDHQPLSGSSLYRLVLVNKDGKKDFYDVKRIYIPTEWKTVVNIPSPITATLPVYINVQERNHVRISLFDLHGTLITRYEKVFSRGISVTSIDVSRLSKGTYIVHVQHESGLVTKKVVIN